MPIETKMATDEKDIPRYNYEIKCKNGLFCVFFLHLSPFIRKFWNLMTNLIGNCQISCCSKFLLKQAHTKTNKQMLVDGFRVRFTVCICVIFALIIGFGVYFVVVVMLVALRALYPVHYWQYLSIKQNPSSAMLPIVIAAVSTQWK